MLGKVRLSLAYIRVSNPWNHRTAHWLIFVNGCTLILKGSTTCSPQLSCVNRNLLSGEHLWSSHPCKAPDFASWWLNWPAGKYRLDKTSGAFSHWEYLILEPWAVFDLQVVGSAKWWHAAERGSPLRPFPRVLLCPQNIPKLRSCTGLVVIWIWASLITVLLFFGSMGVACWVSNQSTNFAARPATRRYKKPELLGWDPPGPPPRQHNRFQYTLPSHIESRVAHLGGKVGPRQKARRFVMQGIMAKKAQIQEARPLCMHVELASIFISYVRVSFHLHRILNPGILVMPTHITHRNPWKLHQLDGFRNFPTKKDTKSRYLMGKPTLSVNFIHCDHFLHRHKAESQPKTHVQHCRNGFPMKFA